jgi:Hydrophobic surface binding protein A
MIFTRLLSILALVFAVAADFEKYNDAYSAIANSMTALDEAIFDISDASTISALAPLTKAVLDSVQDGIKTISAQPALTSEEASNFIVTAQMQLDGVSLVVTDLEARKSEIESAKGKSVVLDIVKKLKEANKQLDELVLTKLPADVKPLIQDQSKEIAASLDKSASLFAG